MQRVVWVLGFSCFLKKSRNLLNPGGGGKRGKKKVSPYRGWVREGELTRPRKEKMVFRGRRKKGKRKTYSLPGRKTKLGIACRDSVFQVGLKCRTSSQSKKKGREIIRSGVGSYCKGWGAEKKRQRTTKRGNYAEIKKPEKTSRIL